MSSVLGRYARRSYPRPNRLGGLGFPAQRNDPRIPPGLSRSDVLAVYDPEWSRTNEWATDQALTVNGTAAFVEASGSLAMDSDGGSFWLSGTPPLASLDGEEPITLAAVAIMDDSGSFGNRLISVEDGAGATVNSMYAVLRASFGGGGQFYENSTGDNAFADAGSLTVGQVHVSAITMRASEVQGYLDGVAGTAAAINGGPVSLDNFTVGNVSAILGDSRIFYAIMYRGDDAAALQAWAEATFPVGEDLSPAATTTPWTGTDSANAVSYWLASDPLVDQQDGSSWSEVGSPSISTIRGADCLTLDGSSGYLRDTSCLATLAEGETATVYLLMEAPTGVAASVNYLTKIDSNPTGDWIAIGIFGGTQNYAQARDGTTQTQDTQSGSSVDTVYVLSAEVSDDGASGWLIEAGRDATQTGSPAGSASGASPNTFDGDDEIGNVGSGNDNGYRIWARLVVQGAGFSSAIAAELVAAVGVS